MGERTFLDGGDPKPPHSVADAIELLAETSREFVDSWGRNNSLAGRASERAMQYFDHIISEFLRHRDELISSEQYADSQLERELSKSDYARWVKGVSRSDQYALVESGAGNGNLPEGEVQPLSFGKLITKIKHRKPSFINFRLGLEKQHILLMAVDLQRGRPDSIIEFDVQEFVQQSFRVNELIV